MKYGHLNLDQLEAVIDKLGGVENFNAIASSTKVAVNILPDEVQVSVRKPRPVPEFKPHGPLALTDEKGKVIAHIPAARTVEEEWMIMTALSVM